MHIAFSVFQLTKEKSRASCRDSKKHSFFNLVKNQDHLLNAGTYKLLTRMQL